jgi:hypothetical protein
MMVNPIARILVAALLAAMFAAPLNAQTWDQAHGDSTNSGYANVKTAPATGSPRIIGSHGPFAPGAGFAIASNGYFFVGNDSGGVFGFSADGSTKPFVAQLENGESIAGAPLIGPNDDVYVVAVKGRGTRQPESSLSRFTIGGVAKERQLFPQHGGSRGEVMGAPVVFRTGNGANALIATVVAYPNQVSGGYETRLITFVNGNPFIDQRVDVLVPETGEAADVVAKGQIKPRGGVAIITPGSGNQPYFLVSDGFQSLSGFRFTNGGLVEDFHLRDDSRFHSIVGTPMLTVDGYYYVGTTKGLMIGHPGNQLPLFTKKEMKTNAPAAALRKPGRVAVGGGHPVDLYSGTQPGSSWHHGGETHTAIAASYTHFYVSYTDALLTFDNQNVQLSGRFDWSGGGQNPPAIGPKGHVYAIAGNNIYVFPPPKATPFDNVGVFQPGTTSSPDAGVDGTGGTGAAPGTAPMVMQPAAPITVMEPNASVALQPPAPIAPMQPVQPTSQAQAQRFQPPMTTNGNRLFACEELDQDDCGKGDHKDISLAFCQAQGFTRAEDYDVDSRKLSAETLDGRFCTKNKCKVFDRIDCANN